MNSVLEFKNTSKIYLDGFWGKKVYALQNLTLSVPKGTIYGFLGANGAGKTTSIKILLGLQFPNTGECTLLGMPCGAEAARRKVGYLPERPYFHDNLTANEFLTFHRSLFGKIKLCRYSNSELLKLVGIPGTEKKLLRSFSKGMLQRIGIAQTLLNDPELVILDEPMSGLDPVGRRDIRNLILHLASEGKTIFFSTHILADVESVCQKIAFLEKGILKYEGDLESILRGDANDIEIIFAKLSADSIAKESLLQNAIGFGNDWKIQAKGHAQCQAILEKIWSLGGMVNSFGRVQKTLESALFGLGKEL